MFEAEQQQLDQRIRAFCAENGLPEPKLMWGWIPFNGQWGISTSFFQLAAMEARQGQKKINVNERAVELAQQLAAYLGKLEGFSQVEAVKGYLNLYYAPSEYTRRVIDGVLEQGKTYGCGPQRGDQVMVEFSQPNTHKAMHVGHLRSAILGDVIARILDCAGYDVVRANYPGDIGLHVIKWLWNYMKHHSGERPEKDITKWMGAMYAEANKRWEDNTELRKKLQEENTPESLKQLAETPNVDAEIRALYARWDKRDPEVVKLWEETRQWSLDGFHEIYDQLDIRFDRYYFPSMAEHPGKEVVNELIANGIAQDERPAGPVIVKIDERLGLKNEKYRVLVVLRSDNTALYATDDLALAKIKFNDYPEMVNSLYVVDVRQSLHFQQVFKTLELAGYPWADRCQHIPYELVNLPGNVVMASRDGTVVLLEDLLREAVRRALEVVEAKNPDLSPELKMAAARAVGLGAIKYPIIARESTKTVTFDWQSALDLSGQSSVYIQYAAARASSILRKSGGNLPAGSGFEYEMSQQEVQLVDLISRLPKEVQRAAAEHRPLYVANLAYDLAKAFSDFYNNCPVLQAEEPVRSGRLRLVAAARQSIANALALLGITAPEAM
jgi:arginyl-tRNA synthetase